MLVIYVLVMIMWSYFFFWFFLGVIDFKISFVACADIINSSNSNEFSWSYCFWNFHHFLSFYFGGFYYLAVLAAVTGFGPFLIELIFVFI